MPAHNLGAADTYGSACSHDTVSAASGILHNFGNGSHSLLWDHQLQLHLVPQLAPLLAFAAATRWQQSLASLRGPDFSLLLLLLLLSHISRVLLCATP